MSGVNAIRLVIFVVIVLILSLSLAVSLQSVHASSVIVFDSAMEKDDNGSSSLVSTLSWSHTIGIGSNPILLVAVSNAENGDAGGTVSVTSVTYGASPLTFLAFETSGPQAFENENISVWYLLPAPPGSATITVTFASPGANAAIGGSVSYFNVNSVVGNAVANDGSGSTMQVTIASSTGDLVVDALVTTTGSSASPMPPQTQRWNSGQVTGEFFPSIVGGASDKPASSPVTMTWAASGTPCFDCTSWAIIAVDLQPAAATLFTEVDAGAGSVNPNCPGPGGCSVVVGSTVTVTANPSASWRFSGWTTTGASCAGGPSNNPCTFTMPNNPVTLSATFIPTAPPPPIPEYSLGLPILTILMLITYGFIKRGTQNPKDT